MPKTVCNQPAQVYNTLNTQLAIATVVPQVHCLQAGGLVQASNAQSHVLATLWRRIDLDASDDRAMS